jgi:FAD-linked oxidoreductase
VTAALPASHREAPALDAISRRAVLQAAGGAAVLAGLGFGAAGCQGDDGSPSRPRRDGSWSNWSGSATAHPKTWLLPANETDLANEVRRARGPVRVVGAGHSFSPLVATDDLLISLDALAGIVDHDAVTAQATIWAGTRLHDLGEPLWKRGQALVNQGDIDKQSLGGAIGTSTHGTGVTLGSFSSAVRGLRLLTADGEIVECGPDRDADVFHAARSAIGSLGVVTQVRMQNRAAYSLREVQSTRPLDEVLGDLDGLIAGHRHFEFWAFHAASDVLVKTLDETDAEPTAPPAIPLPIDTAVHLASELAHGVPALARSLQRLLTAVAPESERVDRSYRVYPSPRSVRFNEMEYEVPIQRGPDCLHEIRAAVERSGLTTFFPIEYRTVAGDDCWLSPFYGRASASISIHQYYKVDYRELFAVVEPIFWNHQGRPHWGKLHTLDAARLAPLYPQWDAFQAVRRRLDPQGKFLNPHVRHVLEAA